MANHPQSVEEIYDDFVGRRSALLRALTDEVESLWELCDPNKENLCLYGASDQSWAVELPAEEVPPELPEPCLGINFARDGMQRRDWLALVAVHSDAWLLAVAFYYGAKLDVNGRARLFHHINQFPTLYEMVTGRHMRGKAGNRRKQPDMGSSRQPDVAASDAPLPSGRLLVYDDIGPHLKGRQAELYWPDDKRWWRVEIVSLNLKVRTAKIQYTSGEFEELELDEIVREGHMSLIG